MGFRDWLLGVVGGSEYRTQRLIEAADPFYGAKGDIDPDPHLWRPLSRHQDRALPHYTQSRQIEIAHWLWKTNPLARRLIELTVDYILGDEWQHRAIDAGVQGVLDRFVDDPVNALRRKLKDKARFLFVFGEGFYPAFVNPMNGTVRLGYIDPSLVPAVQLDEGNAEIVRKVAVRATQLSEARTFDVVNYDDATGLRKGDIIFWAVNRPPNSSRGASDLLAGADWIDGLNQFLISTVDRVYLQNSLVWDVTVKGADPKTIKDMQGKTPTSIRPGMVRWHNERTEWKPLSPAIQGEDLAEIGRMLKTYIGVGAGFPPHWLGEEGSANRATAAEMGVPVVKGLKSRQTEIKCFVAELFEFVIDCAIAAGQLDRDVDRRFEVTLPTIWAVDTDRIADALSKLTLSLGDATMQGWLGAEEAGVVYRYVLGQLGLNLDNVVEATGERPKAVTPDAAEQTAAAAALDAARSRRGGAAGA